MGIWNRLWHTATKNVTKGTFQQKAVKKAAAIAEGEKVPPPRYARELENFEKTRDDPKLKELINKKDEKLIENMNKFEITSTDPPERWTSTKQLPTRESEWEHRNDPTWEYGFYEPPVEQMEKNRIMLKEALEILRNRTEAELPGPDGKRRKFADEAQKKYNEHPAVSRIDPDKLENLWKYFRPFERHEEQRVVHKADLKALRDIVEGRDEGLIAPGEDTILDGLIRKQAEYHKQVSTATHAQLSDAEKEAFLEAAKSKREAEQKRLASTLRSITDGEQDKEKEDKEKEPKKAKQ